MAQAGPCPPRGSPGQGRAAAAAGSGGRGGCALRARAVLRGFVGGGLSPAVFLPNLRPLLLPKATLTLRVPVACAGLFPVPSRVTGLPGALRCVRAEREHEASPSTGRLREIADNN